MRYRTTITATLLTVGLLAAASAASAQESGVPQQHPRIDLSIVTRGAPSGIFDNASNLASRFGRHIRYTLREFILVSEIVPLPDQAQGNTLLQRSRRNRGLFRGRGLTPFPIYVGPRPSGPPAE